MIAKFICSNCGSVNGGKSKHKPFTVGTGKIVCCGHCGTVKKDNK